METTVTNLPGHKGAFAQTMQGGAIYYTPDITADEPEWREVFDLTDRRTSTTDPASTYYGGGSNGGWIQTSLDDKYLYHAVVGPPASRRRHRLAAVHPQAGHPGAARLRRRRAVQHRHDRRGHRDGGAEADCPAIVDTLPAAGGPHWGALDNLELGEDGLLPRDHGREAARLLELLRRPHRSQRRPPRLHRRRGRGRRRWRWTRSSATSGPARPASTSTGRPGRTATGVRRSRTRCCSSRPTTTSADAIVRPLDACCRPSVRRSSSSEAPSYAGTGSLRPATSPGPATPWPAALAGAPSGSRCSAAHASPGVPSVQRMRHDDVDVHRHGGPGAARPQPGPGRQHPPGRRARTRLPPGAGGDGRGRPRPRPSPPRNRRPLGRRRPAPREAAPCSSRTGRRHRVPFAVETGTEPADPDLDRPRRTGVPRRRHRGDAGRRRRRGHVPGRRPLPPRTQTALRSVVDTLGTRGVEQLAVEHDDSARSVAAYDVVRAAAAEAGIAGRRPRPPHPAGATPCSSSAAGPTPATALRR